MTDDKKPMHTLTLTEQECNVSSIIENMEHAFGTDANYWFRGQANYEYDLLPSIFRQGSKFGGCQLDEAAMLSEFQRTYPDKKNTHTNTLEWLSLMQHYGLPTRILDWSTNILVGIFFAVESNMGQDGSLYVFNPASLEAIENEHSLNIKISMVKDWRLFRKFLAKNLNHIFNQLKIIYSEFKTLDPDITFAPLIKLNDMSGKVIFETEKINIFFKLIENDPLLWLKEKQSNPILLNETHFDLPVAIDNEIDNAFNDLRNKFNKTLNSNLKTLSTTSIATPSHLNERIRAQHGVFTMHGGKFIDGVEVLKFQHPEEVWGEDLLKIKIPASGKAKLLKELAYAGITKATLFPDMENVAQAIKEKHTCYPS